MLSLLLQPARPVICAGDGGFDLSGGSGGAVDADLDQDRPDGGRANGATDTREWTA
ncbi:MAG: hypothetical protein L0H26_05360 [Microlunatus sp.]|nr:hypothetical protein [Microlunatus sp.]